MGIQRCRLRAGRSSYKRNRESGGKVRKFFWYISFTQGENKKTTVKMQQTYANFCLIGLVSLTLLVTGKHKLLGRSAAGIQTSRFCRCFELAYPQALRRGAGGGACAACLLHAIQAQIHLPMSRGAQGPQVFFPRAQGMQEVRHLPRRCG